MNFHSTVSDMLRDRIQPEFVFCQVLIKRDASGFALRHALDRVADGRCLKKVQIPELRGIAQSTAAGAFRPLKSAPTLQQGWQVLAKSIEDVIDALDHLYPGGLADWRASQSEPPPVTSYRDFTGRQTGMYRITTFLDDSQAADMTQACCDGRFCLKRRLWTVDSLKPDAPDQKSILPCLEPCAILLEFARKVTRLEQDEDTPAELAACDPEILQRKLDGLLAKGPEADQREADFSHPDNPRILLWELLKLGRR